MDGSNNSDNENNKKSGTNVNQEDNRDVTVIVHWIVYGQSVLKKTLDLRKIG